MEGFISVLREAIFSNITAKQIGCMTVFQGVKHVVLYLTLYYHS